jgi:hypothetical protein
LEAGCLGVNHLRVPLCPEVQLHRRASPAVG